MSALTLLTWSTTHFSMSKSYYYLLICLTPQWWRQVTRGSGEQREKKGELRPINVGEIPNEPQGQSYFLTHMVVSHSALHSKHCHCSKQTQECLQTYFVSVCIPVYDMHERAIFAYVRVCIWVFVWVVRRVFCLLIHVDESQVKTQRPTLVPFS